MVLMGSLLPLLTHTYSLDGYSVASLRAVRSSLGFPRIPITYVVSPGDWTWWTWSRTWSTPRSSCYSFFKYLPSSSPCWNLHVPCFCSWTLRWIQPCFRWVHSLMSRKEHRNKHLKWLSKYILAGNQNSTRSENNILQDLCLIQIELRRGDKKETVLINHLCARLQLY